MPAVIAVVVAVAVIAAVIILSRRRSSTAAAPAAEPGRIRPAVAEFHVVGDAARVHFEVPVPAGGADEVLAELLGREAVEVVREKRHTLPIGDVRRVVALGRQGSAWHEVRTIALDTPGELPPPLLPELIPHSQRREFDPFARLVELPDQPPATQVRAGDERLPRLVLRLPAAAEAALRTQGIDPGTADATAVLVGLMRGAGYQMTESAAGTYRADRAGQRTFVRIVPHGATDYPELDEKDIRRFVVDFASSGAARGLLLTEKWAPFEIYDRERRDPRVRFVGRERMQSFADVLAVG